MKELYVPIFLKVNLMILTLSVVAEQFANKLAITSSVAHSMSKFVTSRHLLLPFTLRSAALKEPVDWPEPMTGGLLRSAALSELK